VQRQVSRHSFWPGKYTLDGQQREGSGSRILRRAARAEKLSKIFKRNICYDHACHHTEVCIKGIDFGANFISLFEDMRRIFLYKLR